MSDQPSQLAQTEKRYCPECGTGVNGTAAAFANRVACPKCKANVRFLDLLDGQHNGFTESSEPKDKRAFQLLAICVSLTVIVLVLMIILVVTGYALSAAFFGFLLFLIGVLTIIVAVERHHRVDVLRQQIVDFGELKQQHFNILEKCRSFERNANLVIRDHKAKLDQAAESEKRQLGAQKVSFAASQKESIDAWNRKMAVAESDLELEKKDWAETKAKREERWTKKVDALTEKLKQCQEQLKDAASQVSSETVQLLSEKYLKDMVVETTKDVTSNNFATSKSKIEKLIAYCRNEGAEISREVEDSIYATLRARFEELVRKEAAKAEQQRIKERIREEEKAQAEIERELKRLQNEQAAIQLAIEQALARTHDEHSAEVEDLRRRLREAEEKSQRALSMAQQTKAGHVYVISNLGSFGPNVFKIGMTRRLVPQDRIRELGDASVPFEFDVHMMISCDDAPRLENALHRHLHTARINKVNFRKEFFTATIEQIREIVEKNHCTVDYVAEPEALEYFESQKLHGEDLEFVENVLEKYQNDDEEQ